jgi:hypothetical protein
MHTNYRTAHSLKDARSHMQQFEGIVILESLPEEEEEEEEGSKNHLLYLMSVVHNQKAHLH